MISAWYTKKIEIYDIYRDKSYDLSYSYRSKKGHGIQNVLIQYFVFIPVCCILSLWHCQPIETKISKKNCLLVISRFILKTSSQQKNIFIACCKNSMEQNISQAQLRTFLFQDLAQLYCCHHWQSPIFQFQQLLKIMLFLMIQTTFWFTIFTYEPSFVYPPMIIVSSPVVIDPWRYLRFCKFP